MTTLLGLLGALQGLILALAVVSLGGPERRPNRALGLVLSTLAVSVLAITADHGGLFTPAIYPVLLEYTVSLLFPPALWHYASVVLGRRRRLSVAVHLLPAAVWIAYMAAYALGWTERRWLPPIMAIVGYSVGYTVAVATRVWRRGATSRSLVSHHRVLRAVVVALAVLHVAQLVRFLGRQVEWLADIVPLTATAMICVLSVLAFRQSRFFAGREAEPTEGKYASSTLTPEGAAALRQSLLETMNRDKPFLNENLNLADLAARLGAPRSHLSQVVNAELGKNFSDFLSRYRVEEAERLLVDPAWDHLTIEAIGYEVGFRSRSAFHSAFRRLRGETPAAARKRLS